MSKGNDRSCKTCRHLDVAPNRGGRRVVYAGRAYPCTVPVSDSALPECITKSYGFVPVSKARRSHVMPGDGAECPMWEGRG